MNKKLLTPQIITVVNSLTLRLIMLGVYVYVCMCALVCINQGIIRYTVNREIFMWKLFMW